MVKLTLFSSGKVSSDIDIDNRHWQLVLILSIIIDPRTDGMFGMESPWPTIAVCLGYVLVVTSLGPRFMAGRKPMEVKNIMIWYNFAMVGFCGYIMYEVRVSSAIVWGRGWVNPLLWAAHLYLLSLSVMRLLRSTLAYIAFQRELGIHFQCGIKTNHLSWVISNSLIVIHISKSENFGLLLCC